MYDFIKELKPPVTGRKRQVNFLDLLIQASSNDGVGLTEQEIREEVDTFMFEASNVNISYNVHGIINGIFLRRIRICSVTMHGIFNTRRIRFL
jgi:hypothetical protein